MALERRSFTFLCVEYATVIWEMPSSLMVSCNVASTIDLTVFLGMPFLLYSIWINSLLGLLRTFCGGELVACGVRQWGRRRFLSNLLLLSRIMCFSTVLFQSLAAWQLNNLSTTSR